MRRNLLDLQLYLPKLTLAVELLIDQLIKNSLVFLFLFLESLSTTSQTILLDFHLQFELLVKLNPLCLQLALKLLLLLI